MKTQPFHKGSVSPPPGGLHPSEIAADAGVALAHKRAKELGLSLDLSAVRDSEYEFGKERFDLILFSWSMPLIPVEKVIATDVLRLIATKPR
jgi:hypothetical protein